MAAAFMGSTITTSVERLVGSLAGLPDEKLTLPWPEPGQPGERWHGYLGNARDAAYYVQLMLKRLAREVERGSRTSNVTAICRSHHQAYRELAGLLAGVTPDDFKRAPDEHEWSISTVVEHVTETELGFSMLIDWAAERQRSADGKPIRMPREMMQPQYDALDFSGDMAGVLDEYARLHQRVLANVSAFGAEDLEAVNVWWEGYEIPVWFRLHRFETHLREHIIQVEKTLVQLGRIPTESERLARLLHQALAEVEVALLGAADDAADQLADEQAAVVAHCRLLLERL